MAKSQSEIIHDIESFVIKHGGRFAEWYVGMSADAKASLFNTHGFKKGDTGLMRTALTEMQAHGVVEYFVSSRGCAGNAANFNSGDVHVYAYRRAKHTKP